MISHLVGRVIEKDSHEITLLTSGGVGYTVGLSLLHATEIALGQELHLPVYYRATEQSHQLFGFRGTSERSFFELLLSVKGVGPKSALHILSLGTIAEIQDAIARQDVSYLTAVQGMGKKTAERVVVELKGKMGDAGSVHTAEGGDLKDVIDALVSMGYGKDEARTAAKEVADQEGGAEALLREALKRLSR